MSNRQIITAVETKIEIEIETNQFLKKNQDWEIVKIYVFLSCEILWLLSVSPSHSPLIIFKGSLLIEKMEHL